MLYMRDKDYVKLLRTYIDDHFRQNQVFNFVQKTLSEDDNDKKGQVEKSVLDDIDALIKIDTKKTATVIFFHMYPFINLILAKLESNKSILYEFLKYLLELKEGGSQTSTPTRGNIEDPLTTSETYETYVDLMCQLDSKSVSAFLRSKSSSFRPDVALRIVTKHGIKVNSKLI